MSILYTILIILEAIVCFLLIGIVLLQKSTGDGNGLSFGGGAESVFGAETGNILTRGTVILAVIFLVNTLILGCLGGKAVRGSAKSLADEIMEQDKAAKAVEAVNTADVEDVLNTIEAPAAEAPVADATEAVEAPAAEAPAAPATEAAPAAEAPAPAAEAAAPAAETPAATAEAPAAPAAE